jgi:nucleotide-binding universal stress UspA family protein
MHRIVVGVDGSEGAQRALAWAVELAEQTGAEVEAVEAWELSYAWVDGYTPDLDRWTREVERAAEERLDRAVDAVRGGEGRYVQITKTVVEGPATRVLLDSSKDADLLVVGSRGRGGFTGLLLGSVGQACAHHARIPVVIIPPVD